MNHNNSGGYVGLLALLIVVLLIGLMFWRMDLFSGNSSGNGISPTEQDIGAIKAAEKAKQMMESKYNQQMKEIGN